MPQASLSTATTAAVPARSIDPAALPRRRRAFSFVRDVSEQPVLQVVVVALLGSALINAVLHGLGGLGDNDSAEDFWRDYLFGVAVGATMWVSMAFLNSALSRRLPWLSQPWQAFGTAFVSNVVVAVLALGSVYFVMFVVIGGEPAVTWFERQRIGHYVGSVVIGLLITAIFQGAYFVRLWKASFKEAEALKSANLAAQYEVLNAQVNPHFLFNSLNVLSALVRQDPAQAESFIQGLSEVYRYVLEVRGETLVPLSRELRALDAYAKLATMRFGTARLRIEVRVPPSDSLQVVPLALQMLIENAVKHNGATRKTPLVIEVLAEADQLIVRNNRVPLYETPDGSGLGLANITERYRLAVGREIEIVQRDDSYEVRLPI